jgi:hypothetical protein
LKKSKDNNNKKMLPKVLLLCILMTIGSCVYNATLGKKLAIASAIAFASDAEIAQWTCKLCSSLPMIRVRVGKYID